MVLKDKRENSNCSNCGELLYCGVEGGKSQCWCMDETPSESIRIKFSNISDGCVCKKCLTTEE